MHNVKFKEEISFNIKRSFERRRSIKIVQTLTNQAPFIEDYNDYYKACREIKHIKKQIENLGFEDRIYENALMLGQRLTVLLSYSNSNFNYMKTIVTQ